MIEHIRTVRVNGVLTVLGKNASLRLLIAKSDLPTPNHVRVKQMLSAALKTSANAIIRCLKPPTRNL